jgi:hypothetical protein
MVMEVVMMKFRILTLLWRGLASSKYGGWSIHTETDMG